MRFYGFSQPTRSSPAPPPACSTSRSTRSSPGRCATAALSRSTSTAPAARCCCACRSRREGRSSASLATRRLRRLRIEDVGRLCQSIAKVTALHRRRRLVARRHDRRPSPAPAARSETTPAELVLMANPARLLAPAPYVVNLKSEVGFEGWRSAARSLALASVEPASVVWQVSGDWQNLFASAAMPPVIRRRAVHCAARIRRTGRDRHLPFRPRPLRPALSNAAGACATNQTS